MDSDPREAEIGRNGALVGHSEGRSGGAPVDLADFADAARHDLLTDDDIRRVVSELRAARERDPVEAALAKALDAAAAAGRFDVVAQLAKELEARRLAGAANVVPLVTARRGR